MANDDRVDRDADGWTVRFGDPLVTQILVDHRLSLRLAGGALLVFETPFELDRGRGRVRVPPGDAAHEVAEALPLFGQRAVLARVRETGDLQVEFDGGAVLTVAVDPSYENWQISSADGEQWIGLPGGGVAHFGGSARS